MRFRRPIALVFLLLFTGLAIAQVDPNATMTIARVEETETMDPQNTTTISSIEIDAMVYDTLVVLDDQLLPQPGLATWEVSEDGLTYTFALQEDVSFHSGKALTANDVKYTLDRWLASETSPTQYTVEAIADVEVTDDQTIVVRLNEPYVLLLTALAAPFASILNEEFTEAQGENYGTSPETIDGTGPYKLTSWIRQDRMTLSRNDDYTWGPSTVENKGPANFEEVVWRIIPEDSTRIAELEAGNVDFTAQVPEIEVEFLETLPDINIIRYEDPNTTFVGFKMGKEHLNDLNVRRAINHAIDRDELIVGAFAGLATPAYNPSSPKLQFHAEDVTETAYRYDPEKATQLLAEAGWTDTDGDGVVNKDGEALDLLFMYAPSTFTDNLIPLVQEQLGAVGIKVTPRQLEWTAYLAALRAGEHEMMLMSVRYVNEDGFLYFYLSSEQRPAPNRFDFVDEQVDEWLDIGRTSLEDAERSQAYASIQERAVETAVFVPLVHVERAVAASPALENLQIHPFYVLYKLLDPHITN